MVVVVRQTTVPEEGEGMRSERELLHAFIPLSRPENFMSKEHGLEGFSGFALERLHLMVHPLLIFLNAGTEACLEIGKDHGDWVLGSAVRQGSSVEKFRLGVFSGEDAGSALQLVFDHCPELVG